MYTLVPLCGEGQQCYNGRLFYGGQWWVEGKQEGLGSDGVCKDIGSVGHQSSS